MHAADTKAAAGEQQNCDICCGEDGETILHDATVYCIDCEQYLCDQAARLHGRTKTTREHAVVPMEDAEFRKARPQPSCPFHGMPIEYLCLEDDCLVCVKCLPCPIHNGHRCKAIPEALADENRMISADLIQEGRGKIDLVSRALRVAEETIDGVDERQRLVKGQVNSYVDELEAVLQQQRNELLKRVDETTTSKLKILSAQAEALRCILESLVNGVDHLERHDTNEARDLLMKRAFRKSVENTHLSMEPDALNDLEFVAREETQDLLGSLGEVAESGPCAFNTTAGGPGVLAYQMQAQKGMKFTVSARSRTSLPVTRGGERVSIKVDKNLNPEWQVEDVGNGTYEVEYRLNSDRLRDERSFRLFVRLNSKDIQGSPFTVPVRKDYNYVVDRSLQGIGLVSGGIIDGDYIFVALYSQNQIVKVRRDTGAQEQRIPVNGQPYGMCVDGQLLYVCLYNTHYVGVYNKETGAQERMLGGPGVFMNPVGLAQEGEELFITEHVAHRLQVVRKDDGTPIRRLEDATLRSPFGLLLDEQHIYISSNTGNHVKVYSKGTLNLVHTVGESGGQFLQSPISLTQEDDILFVGCNGNNLVQLYRKGTFEALGTIHNVNQPYGACTHKNFLYLCCMGVSAVTVLRPSFLDPSPHAPKVVTVPFAPTGAGTLEGIAGGGGIGEAGVLGLGGVEFEDGTENGSDLERIRGGRDALLRGDGDGMVRAGSRGETGGRAAVRGHAGDGMLPALNAGPADHDLVDFGDGDY